MLKRSILEDCWQAFCSQAFKQNRMWINKHRPIDSQEPHWKRGKNGHRGAWWNTTEWCVLSAQKLLKSLGCLHVSSACPASARCCREIKTLQVLEEGKSSHACSHKTLISPHTQLSLSPLFLFFCFVITESKGIEWASPCEQFQMLQCQHAWPQAILFAIMEGNGLDNAWPGALV